MAWNQRIGTAPDSKTAFCKVMRFSCIWINAISYCIDPTAIKAIILRDPAHGNNQMASLRMHCTALLARHGYPLEERDPPQPAEQYYASLKFRLKLVSAQASPAGSIDRHAVKRMLQVNVGSLLNLYQKEFALLATTWCSGAAFLTCQALRNNSQVPETHFSVISQSLTAPIASGQLTALLDPGWPLSCLKRCKCTFAETHCLVI